MSLLLEKTNETKPEEEKCPLNGDVKNKISNEIKKFLDKMCKITGKEAAVGIPFPECRDDITVDGTIKFVKDNVLFFVKVC